MTTKEKMIAVMEELPSDATIEDAMDRLVFMAKLERGLREADEDMTISHEELRERMAKWLS